MPTISVIVPVYKVEPYIRKCVDSILGQTFSDIQVILVDDGSPDQCGKICDEYARLFIRKMVVCLMPEMLEFPMQKENISFF